MAEHTRGDAGAKPLIARLSESIDVYLALGNACEIAESPRVRWVRNPERPRVWDANHASGVRAAAPAEIEAVLARAETRFGPQATRCFHCDPLTPPAFEARLALEDYRAQPELELVLEGELRAPPARFAIRPAESPADWRQLAELLRRDHAEQAARRREPPYGGDVLEGLLAARRDKQPAQRTWIARVDGVDCAHVSSWPGVEGVGKVEDLFALPEFRRRGIATALLARAVADARERGAREVGIAARPDDTPKHLYARLGFRPLCLRRQYLKRAPAQ